jgi:hypothetical protein
VTAVDISPTTRPRRCRDAPIPPAGDLTYQQGKGWHCYACGRRLTAGAVLAGRAVGRAGAHDLSADVYACP